MTGSSDETEGGGTGWDLKVEEASVVAPRRWWFVVEDGGVEWLAAELLRSGQWIWGQPRVEDGYADVHCWTRRCLMVARVARSSIPGRCCYIGRGQGKKLEVEMGVSHGGGACWGRFGGG